jgi:hypothetical protein
MKQKLKTYSIDGVEVRFKDLTYNETARVNEIMQFDGKTAEVNDLEFFKIVLEPVAKGNAKGTPLEEVIDFGNIKESVQLEVLRDFLLSRIERQSEFKKSFMNSIKNRLK